MPRHTTKASPDVVLLPCAAVQVDANIQPREHLTAHVVSDYATFYEEAADDGDVLPPLDVFHVDGVYYVTDGFHRLEGARRAGRETIACRVHQGTRRDAMVFAAFANTGRGLPYSYGDKQRVVERLLRDPECQRRGDRDLARALGMSHVQVWRVRTRLAEEARLEAELAALPATAKAPQARAQEQLAQYLGVPVQTLKDLGAQSSGGYAGLRGKTTPVLVKELASSADWSDFSPQQAATTLAERIERLSRDEAAVRAKRTRPSMSKAAIAARKEEAQRQEREDTLLWAINDVVELYPFTPEEQGFAPDDPDYFAIPTAEELVQAVSPDRVEYLAERLRLARAVLDALWRAWEARMQRATPPGA